MKHRITVEGRVDLAQACDFYQSQRDGLGNEFAVEVGLAIAQLLDAPTRWPEVEQGLRKYRLNRFPFAIYYRVELGKTLVIVAIIDLRSNPDSWNERLR